ncbi:hypothetical protein B0H13DRAFT_1635069 [Mycena leptocephala]|nr:hypothetical protein B0H13DRAFT_1635069 [Mycena leptocephala]
MTRSGSYSGRPSSLHVEEYDVGLPLEVDDEYWESRDPEQAFKQPAGKPSLLAYFLCHITLCEILLFYLLSLRIMYGSNKSRALLGLIGGEWERRAISELDAAANDFFSSIPEHREDPYRLSVASLTKFLVPFYLTADYIPQIHRPYIHKPTILALPSLTTCTAAACSLIHVTEAWINKTQRITLVHLHTGILIAGDVLLLNLFGVKRAGLQIDEAKELAHVDMAMRILQFHEGR